MEKFQIRMEVLLQTGIKERQVSLDEKKQLPQGSDSLTLPLEPIASETDRANTFHKNLYAKIHPS